MRTFTETLCSRACESSLRFLSRPVLIEVTSGIETEMIPAAMISHRIMGIMAHWREFMGKGPEFTSR